MIFLNIQNLRRDRKQGNFLRLSNCTLSYFCIFYCFFQPICVACSYCSKQKIWIINCAQSGKLKSQNSKYFRLIKWNVVLGETVLWRENNLFVSKLIWNRSKLLCFEDIWTFQLLHIIKLKLAKSIMNLAKSIFETSIACLWLNFFDEKWGREPEHADNFLQETVGNYQKFLQLKRNPTVLQIGNIVTADI